MPVPVAGASAKIVAEKERFAHMLARPLTRHPENYSGTNEKEHGQRERAFDRAGCLPVGSLHAEPAMERRHLCEKTARVWSRFAKHGCRIRIEQQHTRRLAPEGDFDWRCRLAVQSNCCRRSMRVFLPAFNQHG